MQVILEFHATYKVMIIRYGVGEEICLIAVVGLSPGLLSLSFLVALLFYVALVVVCCPCCFLLPSCFLLPLLVLIAFLYNSALAV